MSDFRRGNRGMRQYALLALTVLALMCGACSGRSTSLDRAQQDLLSAGLPRIPGLKSTSVQQLDSLTGVQTFLRSSGAVEEQELPLPTATFLRLDSSDGGHFEWAVYSLNVPNPLTELRVALDNLDETDEAFIGLADFEREAWQFSGPHTSASDTSTPETDTGVFSVPLDDVKNRNGGGSTFIAVVSPLGNNIRVGGITFVSTGPDAPVADIQADVTTGDTPLLVNLDASGSTDADGTIVKYEWDVNGDGSFETDTGATANTVSNYGSGGVFNVALRVTDDDGLTATDSIEIVVTEAGNIPPIPVLIADKTEGEAADSFKVNFTSDQSEDRDGTITLYEWDLDGDASTGTNGFEASSPVPDPNLVTFDTPGEFRIRLRVTDNGGLQRIASVKISSHGWVQVVADTSSDILTGSLALAKVGKGPGFIYMDGLGQSLHFARATSDAGDNALDWSSVALKSVTNGHSDSISFIGAKAAIAYVDNPSTTFDLTVARHVSGNILNPANWSFTTLNEAMKSMTTPISVAEVDGTPALAYSGHTSPQDTLAMKYARSDTPGGDVASDWQIVTVAEDVNFLRGSADLTVVDGRPAFLARPQAFNGLRYFHSQTAQGLDAADWDFVDLPADGSDRSSMAVIDGDPAICFTAKPNSDDTELRYLRASGPTGDTLGEWGSSVLIDTVTSFPPTFLDTGVQAQLLQAAGQPVLGYISTFFNTSPPGVGTSTLTVERSTSASGDAEADWSLSDELSNAGELSPPTYNVALAEINGRLCAVYWNSKDQQIVYAVHF